MHGPDNEDLKLVSCPRCEYETTNTQCLKRHIDAQHEGQKRFSCSICGFESYYSNYVKSHLASNHRESNWAKVKKIDCENCKHDIDHNRCLRKRPKAMEDDIDTVDMNRFSCPHCKFGTSFAQSLKHHINSQHKDQKRYSCNLCSFRSYCRHHVKSHGVFNHQGPELPKVKKIGCTNCENDLEHNDCRRSHPRKDNLTQSNTIEGQSLEAAFSGIIELFMKRREGKEINGE